jgi:hypothetical protein
MREPVQSAEYVAASDPNPAPKCDHICLKDEGHVERGEPHFYGYELPSPRQGVKMPADKHATVHVELLDTDEVKEILRTLGAENKRLREALEQARECCARPAGVCFDPALTDGTGCVDA